MDDKEVALELLKIYLQYHRERMELDQLVEAYLAILAAIKGGLNVPATSGGAEEPLVSQQGEQKETQESKDDDSLFDFKEPISLSDKEA